MSEPMVQTLALIVPMTLTVIFITALMWFQARQRSRAQVAWSEAAEATNLHHKGSGGGEIEGFLASVEQEITGEVHGGQLRVCWVHDPSAANKIKMDGRVEFEAPLGLGLSIFTKGLLSFGPDLKTGDQAFDEAFIVRADDEHAALLMLRPRVRAALLALRDALPRGFKINDEGLRWTAPTVMTGREGLQAVLERMIAANDAIQTAARNQGEPESDLAVSSTRGGQHTLPAFEEEVSEQEVTEAAGVSSG